jgi:Uma2 family endonuclease
MTTIEVCDPASAERLLAERRALGQDRHDEVWDGVYVMAPEAGDQHQSLVGHLIGILWTVIDLPGLGKVRPGVNISDRDQGWVDNYRVPDVAVFLEGCTARNRESHWLGGPDWAAEIVSPGDRSRAKLDFYAKVGTRELLIVDRDPWVLELYVLKRKKLKLVGRSTADEPNVLTSTVLPLSFQLTVGDAHPLVTVSRIDGEGSWRL